MTTAQGRIGIYPGTFDPITNGHMDIISRALTVVDTLVVGVAGDTGKDVMFPLEERAEMVRLHIDLLPEEDRRRIIIQPFEGLLVSFAEAQGARLLIRGIRAVSDFEYEFQMACMNSRLNDAIETVFLTASEDMHFISSRFVKQIGRLGGDISSFTCPAVDRKMQDYFQRRHA